MEKNREQGRHPPPIEMCICGSARKKDPGSLPFSLNVSAQTSPFSGSSLDLPKLDQLSPQGSWGLHSQFFRFPHPSSSHSVCASLITPLTLWAATPGAPHPHPSAKV